MSGNIIFSIKLKSEMSVFNIIILKFYIHLRPPKEGFSYTYN